MGKEAVVFVHGHMGSPKQFNTIVAKLRNVDIICLTLPGHDADINCFLNTDGEDWQSFLTTTLDQLRRKYDDIILIGHSMGGLLSINAAISCPNKIKAVVAIALPLRIKITFRGMQIRFKTILKQTNKENVEISAAREMNGVSGITVLNAFRLLPNLNELFIIIRRTRRSLSALSVPLVVVNSHNDEIVSAKSIWMVKHALPSAQVVELDQSSHFWVPENDVERIVDVIKALLTGSC